MYSAVFSLNVDVRAAAYVYWLLKNTTSDSQDYTYWYCLDGCSTEVWTEGTGGTLGSGNTDDHGISAVAGDKVKVVWGDSRNAMLAASGATVYLVPGSSGNYNAGTFEMVEVTISAGSTVSEGNTANCSVSRGSASTSYALAVTAYPGGGSPMASYSFTGDTTKDFSAQESGEYSYISGTITILSGNASRTVTVYAWSDGFIESAENARLSIFGTSSYKVKVRRVSQILPYRPINSMPSLTGGNLGVARESSRTWRIGCGGGGEL